MMSQQSKENKEFGSNAKKAFVNSITLSRVLAAFALIPIYNFVGGAAATIFLAIMSCTDFIDGALARKWKVSSFFGSLADAISDKVLAILAILLLFPTFPQIMGLFLGMEALIFGKNLYEARKGNNIKSSMIGKIKTWPLVIAILSGFAISDIGSIITGLQALPNLCQNIPWEPLRNLITSLVNASASEMMPALETIKENPAEVMAIISAPAAIAQGLTLGSYIKSGMVQDCERKEAEEDKVKPTFTLAELNALMEMDSTAYDEEIERRREAIALIQEKKVKLHQMKLKSKDEILRGLFDTQYFEEHKDEPVKQLLFEPKEFEE